MSSSIDISNEKMFTYKLNSLDTSTKISNTNKSNISPRDKRTKLNQNYSKMVLPSINMSINRIKRRKIIEPDSLMSKFLDNYRPNFSDVNPKLSRIIPKERSRNIRLIKSNSLNNVMQPPRKEMKFNSQRIILSEKDKNKIKLLNDKIKNNDNLLDKIKENIFEYKKIINSINDNNEEQSNSKKEIFIINSNIKPIQRDNIKSYSSKAVGNNISINASDKNISYRRIKNIHIPTATSHNCSKISSGNSSSYKRLRKFTMEESKEKNNPITNLNNTDIDSYQNIISSLFENNIKFQSKIFEEQHNLFDGVYKEYKMLTLDDNFIQVFKLKPIFMKIKYNKKIEETCSLLYNLPKIYLQEYHDLLFNADKSNIPDKKNFLDDYVINEIITLKNNNILLTKVVNYFNKSSEVYFILSEQKDETIDIRLDKTNFLNVIKHIKQARYNIIYLINSFNNSKKKLVEDLTIIKKFLSRNKKLNMDKNIGLKKSNKSFSKKILKNPLLLEHEKNKKVDIVEKMEDQFLFQRGEEAKKKIQIENSLKIDKEKQKHNYLGKIINTRKKIYKSIFLNKNMDRILNYCYENIKDQIITEQINDQEDIALDNQKKNRVIKFNKI